MTAFISSNHKKRAPTSDEDEELAAALERLRQGQTDLQIAANRSVQPGYRLEVDAVNNELCVVDAINNRMARVALTWETIING